MVEKPTNESRNTKRCNVMTQVCDMCNGHGYIWSAPEQELNPDGTEDYGTKEFCIDCNGKGRIQQHG